MRFCPAPFCSSEEGGEHRDVDISTSTICLSRSTNFLIVKSRLFQSAQDHMLPFFEQVAEIPDYCSLEFQEKAFFADDFPKI